MSVLITGANGQLGRALQKLFPNAVITDRAELDITDPQSVTGFDWTNIDTIINAAAYTAVDKAEIEPDQAVAVNATAVHYLAEAATRHNATLIHISTDYVFDGHKTGAYTETDPVNPMSVYGRTKAAGDTEAAKTPNYYIVRSSWVIGDGANFVRAILGLARKAISPTVVHDQYGRPTFTSDMAAGIKHLLDSKAPFGLYNLTNEGQIASWADLAREILKAGGFDALEVTNTTAAEYFADKPHPANRPANSVLDLSKIEATGFTPRDWKVALAEYVKEELS